MNSPERGPRHNLDLSQKKWETPSLETLGGWQKWIYVFIGGGVIPIGERST